MSRVFPRARICALTCIPIDLPWPPIKALHAPNSVTEDLPVDANFLFFLFFCGCSFHSLRLFDKSVIPFR